MSISRRQVIHGAAASTLLAGIGRTARAQSYEALKIVTGFPPGGTSDTICRRVAERLRVAGYAKTALVENKTGAGGQIAIQSMKGVAPDGATILQTPMSMLGIYPHIYRKLPYDSERDFVPITNFAWGLGYLLTINPAVPAQSVKELIALAKAGSEPLRYSTPGIGNGQHLAAELFATQAGIQRKMQK